MASISTPVRSAQRATETIVTVPASASISMSGSTWVSGSEWASGISSSVRLAAWIAAIRATAATSPLGLSPRATRAAASGDMRTTARARAKRSVARFVLTSTIRALPAASRCVSSASIHSQRTLRGMVVSVRLFAGLRERAGAAHVDVELPEDATVADLLAALDLAPRSCVAAINREYAAPGERIAPGDEVALVPPVSGGGGDDTVRRVRVTADALDLAALA